MLDITTFNVIETADLVDPLLFYLPESEPFCPSFEQCGYGSTLIIENSSVTIWVYVINFASLVIIFGSVWAIFRTCRTLTWFKNKLSNYFFCNGFIRLYMETFLEIVLTLAVNLSFIDLESDFAAV